VGVKSPTAIEGKRDGGIRAGRRRILAITATNIQDGGAAQTALAGIIHDQRRG
jgi:hypothetical protein